MQGISTGLSARGEKLFIRDSVGYRGAIHRKEHGEKKPALVIGGTAQDFFGEYMAGGVVILLGINLEEAEPRRARFIGTGMHGGVTCLRGRIMEAFKRVGFVADSGRLS